MGMSDKRAFWIGPYLCGRHGSVVDIHWFDVDHRSYGLRIEIDTLQDILANVEGG